MMIEHAYAGNPGQAAAADPRLRRGAGATRVRAVRTAPGRSGRGPAAGAGRRRPRVLAPGGVAEAAGGAPGRLRRRGPADPRAGDRRAAAGRGRPGAAAGRLRDGGAAARGLHARTGRRAGAATLRLGDSTSVQSPTTAHSTAVP